MDLCVSIGPLSNNSGHLYQVTITLDCAESGAALASYEVNLEEAEKVIRNRFFYNERILIPFMQNLPEKQAGDFSLLLNSTGNTLYDAIFPQEKEKLAGNIFASHRRQLKLDIHHSLHHLPWELLRYDDENVDQRSKPIIRYMPHVDTNPQHKESKQPTMYFVGVNPTKKPTSANKQLESIQSILSALPITILNVDYPDGELNQWDRVSKHIQQSPPDILHIVAHGSQADTGIIFEGFNEDDELPPPVSYEVFTDLLSSLSGVKLLVLSICGSGNLFRHNPERVKRLFDSTGLRAAILMATDISHSAAAKFSESLYKALILSKSDVATAVAYSRWELRRSQSSISLEWSTPMLYQSSQISPFEQWIKQMEKDLQVPELQAEHLESVKDTASELHNSVSEFMEVKNQVDPPPVLANYYFERLKDTMDRFQKAMSDLDSVQRYSPVDECLLHSIRVERSRSLGVISRNMIHGVQIHKWKEEEVLSATNSLVSAVTQSYELLQIRKYVHSAE